MIGPEKAVTKYFQRRIFSETLISGGLILSGLILLTLFIIRHEFLSYANLGLFCVVMGIRTLIVGEIPLTYFFPGFNWNLMIRMEYLSMSIGFIFLNSYFFTIYNRFYSRKIFAFFNFLAVLFSIFTVLTPVYVFTGQVLVIQLLILAGIANIFYLFVKSGRVMKEENVILLTGISLLLILVIFDILMANNKLMFLPFKINTSYGLIILILVNSLLLVKQAARITLQLKRLTNNLEEQVHIRTAELEAVNRRLSEQAVTDLLTGVSNRHEFANVMKTEEARYLRTGKKYAALYLDLDNFKYINDTFGHPAGDLILQKFADMLKSIVRDSDYLFRMGGDEFFILMTDVPSAEEGEVLAKRILKETEKREAFRSDIQEFLGHPVRVPERKSFSLSIGVSSTEIPGLDSLHTLPAWSDKALLRAKAEGKNRYAVFTLEDWDN
nr:diguanylate cyclase [Spirochaeta isovalerica]